MFRFLVSLVIMTMFVVNCTENQEPSKPVEQKTNPVKKPSKDLFKKKLPEKKARKQLKNSEKTSAIKKLNTVSQKWTAFEIHKAVTMNIENSRLDGQRSNIDDKTLRVDLIPSETNSAIVLHFEKLIPKSNWHIELDYDGPLKPGKYPLSANSNFGYYESLSIDDYYATTENKVALVGEVEIIEANEKRVIGTAQFTVPKLTEFAVSTGTSYKDFDDVKVDVAFYTSDIRRE